jgi:hypothetical protein
VKDNQLAGQEKASRRGRKGCAEDAKGGENLGLSYAHVAGRTIDLQRYFPQSAIHLQTLGSASFAYLLRPLR